VSAQSHFLIASDSLFVDEVFKQKTKMQGITVQIHKVFSCWLIRVACGIKRCL